MKKGERGVVAPTETKYINTVIGCNAYILFGCGCDAK